MAGQLTIDTLKASTGVLATQNGMTGIAKAWVNFNGTGTVAIRDSFNVSSITDGGTGTYTVNFTTAMPNANYAVAVDANRAGAAQTNGATLGTASFSTTAVQISTYTGTGVSAVDADVVSVTVFGD